ncbi:hypothetical protein QBC39DRAFT_371659 [Podospora conica]|nr:hypothetical protein QBC39DRAFT_371659 [Schizothecium conicum]
MAPVTSPVNLFLREQITDNCSFVSEPRARVSLVIAKEPLGTFKAIAAVTQDGCREALLSESGATVQEALQMLFLRSAEAVQNHIKTAGFDFAPYDDEEDDDEEEDVFATGSADESLSDNEAISVVSVRPVPRRKLPLTKTRSSGSGSGNGSKQPVKANTRRRRSRSRSRSPTSTNRSRSSSSSGSDDDDDEHQEQQPQQVRWSLPPHPNMNYNMHPRPSHPFQPGPLPRPPNSMNFALGPRKHVFPPGFGMPLGMPPMPPMTSGFHPPPPPGATAPKQDQHTPQTAQPARDISLLILVTDHANSTRPPVERRVLAQAPLTSRAIEDAARAYVRQEFSEVSVTAALQRVTLPSGAEFDVSGWRGGDLKGWVDAGLGGGGGIPHFVVQVGMWPSTPRPGAQVPPAPVPGVVQVGEGQGQAGKKKGGAGGGKVSGAVAGPPPPPPGVGWGRPLPPSGTGWPAV